MGKCFDLASAYKQFAVSDADAACSVIAVPRPEDPRQVAYFVARALPFGASGSVVGFNRAAAGFKACLPKILGVPVGNYFDDYPVIVPMASAEVIDCATKKLSGIVGFALKGGEKDAGFTPISRVLGVMFDLSMTIAQGKLRVRNTEGRVRAIGQQIGDILETGRLRPAEASQLAGRLGFASSQLFARSGAAILWHLRLRAKMRGSAGTLSTALSSSLRCWADALVEARPRELDFESSQSLALIFTDGFCESGPRGVVVGVGALMFDTDSGRLETFGAYIPEEVLKALQEECDSEQLIAQAELLPVVAAKQKWADLLSKTGGRRVIHFVDNDAARFGLIKEYSPTRSSAWLLSEIWRVEERLGCVSWYERVPSKSNPADGPSRLYFGRLASLPGAFRVVSVPEGFWSGLLRRREERGA